MGTLASGLHSLASDLASPSTPSPPVCSPSAGVALPAAPLLVATANVHTHLEFRLRLQLAAPLPSTGVRAVSSPGPVREPTSGRERSASWQRSA